MILTLKIQKAINEAAVLHKEQKRKDGLPYVVHLFSVAVIISNYTNDEDVIAAGILHDTLEDVPGYTYDDLKNGFGDRVANIVNGVTEEKHIDQDKKVTWRARKEGYLEKLKHDSTEAMLVCAADKIHNTDSMIDGLSLLGDKYWANFNSFGGNRFWFHDEVLKILQKRLNSPIVKELEKSINRAKEVLNEQ